MEDVDSKTAADALDTVEEAGARVRTMHMYAAVGPYLVVWGTVWVGANAVSDLFAAWSLHAWIAGMLIGTGFTIAISVANARIWSKRTIPSSKRSRQIGFRFAMMGAGVMLYFPAMIAVLGPLSNRQMGTFISLFWTFVYVFAGALIGWRLFSIGMFATVAIVLGYFYVDVHYPLWPGCVGGGSLILGGLWLKRL